VTTIFCLVTIPLLFSQKKIAKEIHESYSINNKSKLAITNKYGNIDIRNWDKEQVDVKVQIVVEDLSEKKIEDVYHDITRLESIFTDRSQGKKSSLKKDFEVWIYRDNKVQKYQEEYLEKLNLLLDRIFSESMIKFRYVS
jgi:hypothetical protein